MLRLLAPRSTPSVYGRLGSASLPTATAGETQPQLSTFANQGRLPRLPVPTLDATAARYLKSLRPLLSAEEYLRSEKAVSAFISSDGMGPILQQRLQEADRQAPSSWLEDIWLKKAYLEWREPSYININWFACLTDNPDFALAPEAIQGRTTPVQLARAARLITHVLEFNESLNQEAIPAEVHRGTPMCMNQFKLQFGTTRIPRPGCDEIVGQFPSTAKHVLLLYRDQTAEVPVYNSEGERASLAQIISQLATATQRIDSLLGSQAQQKQPSVAQLTAGHRDDWTRARALLEQDAANRASFAKTDSALFGVCLDVDIDQQFASDPERSASIFCHSDAGRNRWYDKAFQFIILNNGRAGVNGEHSPVDALTTGRIAMETVQKERGPHKDIKPCAGLEEPAPIQWNVTPEVAQIVDKVRGESKALASNLRIRLGNMREYGAQWIKSIGVSPDAYFQIALQAAYYRHYGKPAPTYETSSLRAFLHGRTETIRSCSEESLAFSKAFDDKDVPLKKKLLFFQQAISSHLEYMKAAASGQGVDRHLLGLRAQIRSQEESERSTLFQDPAYVQSMSFALSTSNVSPGELFRGGFAPVIPDGYGLNYALDKNDLKFAVTDWVSSPETDATAFRETVYKTLIDLHEAAEHAKSRQ
ncbi:acyltransferase ChoActase/COT/CPT [Martensiomyces pterosporus]|nr:acyltransferase ChoActase/COT/CPT [Martensiomyces pterosporus]